MNNVYSSRHDDFIPAARNILDRPVLNPRQTALVVVDMVNYRCIRGIGMLRDMESGGKSMDYYLDRVHNIVLPNHQKLLVICKQYGVKVVFLHSGCFSPDFTDCIPQLQSVYKSWHAMDGAWETQVINPLKVESGDINLSKPG